MAKVTNPFFPEGIGCLKFKPNKNLKRATHVVFTTKNKQRKAVRKNEQIKTWPNRRETSK